VGTELTVTKTARGEDDWYAPQAARTAAGGDYLTVHAVSKTYGPTVALDRVSLSVRGGEVHGLLGENGAGKSTLLKIISAAERADAGTVLVDGHGVGGEPSSALAAGVAMIYQELSLVPGLSAAENMHLGQLPRKHGTVRMDVARRQARNVLDSLGAGDVPVDTPVERLPLNSQQLVEIGRALVRGAHIVVLDEATSALNSSETERLFAVIENLRERGAAVLFVSHHLDEVVRICDRVTVMRDGCVVATRPISEWNEDKLVKAMLASAPSTVFPYHERSIGRPVLSAEDIWLAPFLRGASLELRRGEIVGIAGVVGAGRSELLKVLGGAVAPTSGEVRVDGRRVRLRSPRDALCAGIAYAPKDRKSEGLWIEGSVVENLFMGAWKDCARAGYLFRRRSRTSARRLLRGLTVKVADETSRMGTLSGGNQQKVVIGRLLRHEPRVVLLDEPGRGLDVGAKSAVYSALAALAASGTAVVVSSSDLHDLAGITDRTIVLKHGRIDRELTRSDYSRERLLEAISAG
ncbi:MAG: sugar ABC transporter ATP-binding protein, partial [Acidimicrobiales bacterium]